MEYSERGNSCQPARYSLVDDWLIRAQELLWPSCCVVCGASGPERLDLCAGCEGDLPLNPRACEICAQPLAGPAGSALICGACLRRRPGFHASIVPMRYAYPVDHLIRGLKYRRAVAAGRVLGDLLGREIAGLRAAQPDRPWPQIIVPVPLAARRYAERGYNQASELALCVAKHTGIEIRCDLIERCRETQEQAALKKKDRRKNVRGAFAVTGRLTARHIAVLDDVVTTGSTANEMARVLRCAGAKRIEVWAVARAGR